MKTLIKHFFQGLLYTVPIGATLYVLYKGFLWLDGLLPTELPGLGILIILGALTFIGWIGTYVITTPVQAVGNQLLKKMPLIKVIYTSIKDLLSAFVGKEKSFTKPVFMKVYANSEVRRLGFITDDDLEKLDKSDELIAVYAPHSLAVSGQLYFVPKSYVEPVSARPTDVMKYIISAGVTRVDDYDGKEFNK